MSDVVAKRGPGRPTIGPKVEFRVRAAHKKEAEALAAALGVPVPEAQRLIFSQGLEAVRAAASEKVS